MTEFLNILSKLLILSGGATAIAYGLIKFFGKNLLDYHFSEKLEEFKTEQSLKLQHFQFSIDSEFNRISKVHEKEFEILPEAWKKLQEAHQELVNIAHPFQSWPNLNRYSDAELKSFVENSELKDFQRQELLSAPDKLKYFQEKVFWLRLHKARNKFIEFRKLLKFNKIFFRTELFDIFSKIESVIIVAEVELEHLRKPWQETYEAFKKLTEELEELMKSLETAIQERLHFNDA